MSTALQRINYYVASVMTEEKYRGLIAAKKYPTKWIHFTDMPKLGINPRKSHRDPHGVYFYPNKWLIGLNATGFQYGLIKKYYYIVDVNLAKLKGFNLSTVTQDKIDRLVTANGWSKEYRELKNNPEPLKVTPICKNNPKLLRKAGGMFYTICDYLVNFKKSHTFTQLLKGLDYLSDSSGIINDSEPSQLVVFKLSDIKILESGNNLDDSDKIFNSILQKLADKYQGTLTWKDKKPALAITLQGNPFVVSLYSGAFEDKIDIKYFSKEFGGVQDVYSTSYPVDQGTPADLQDTIERALLRLVDNALPTGTVVNHNLQKISDLVFSSKNRLSLKRSKAYNSETITYFGMSHSQFYNGIRFIIDKKGTLFIELSFSPVKEDDVKVTFKVPFESTLTNEQIASKLVSLLYTKYQEHVTVNPQWYSNIKVENLFTWLFNK